MDRHGRVARKAEWPEWNRRQDEKRGRTCIRERRAAHKMGPARSILRGDRTPVRIQANDGDTAGVSSGGIRMRNSTWLDLTPRRTRHEVNRR